MDYFMFGGFQLYFYNGEYFFIGGEISEECGIDYCYIIVGLFFYCFGFLVNFVFIGVFIDLVIEVVFLIKFQVV